jgi:hypothetical protein
LELVGQTADGLRSADPTDAICRSRLITTPLRCKATARPGQARDDWHGTCYDLSVRFFALPLLLLVGCNAELADSAGFGSGAPDEEQIAFADEDGDCARSRNGSELCAACSFGNVCGLPEEAFCQTRDVGGACSTCVLAAGVIVFDNCEQGSVQATRCEAGSPSLFRALEGLDPNEFACDNCFNDSGVLVSSSCTPLAESCQSRVVGTTRCEECARDGTVVTTECQLAAPASTCVSYANEDGVCLDCFDGDVLVLHQCTPTDATIARCSATSRGDGVFCESCFAASGALIHYECEDLFDRAVGCEVLTFSDQECVVCESGDRPLVVSCEANGCELQRCDVDADCAPDQVCDGARCTDPGEFVDSDGDGEADAFVPPAQEGGCSVLSSCSISSNGEQLCRTCEGPDGVETNCLAGTPITCQRVAASTLMDGGASAEDAIEGAASCLVCVERSSGTEVWTDCGVTNEEVPAPTCATLDGSCQVCSEFTTDDPVYSNCDGVSCSGFSSVELMQPDGSVVMVNDQVAHASCATCENAPSPTQLTCDVLEMCDVVDPWVGASPCVESVPVEVGTQWCGNPWGDGFTSRGDELAAALSMGWSNNLAVARASMTESVDMCTSCDCTRTATLTVWVSAEDADAAARLFAPARNAGAMRP